ncbi:TetR-like C-terminal domain-containing protein [Streptomyces scopuliridis]|uniref:TetR-like C-terminal domain-containing protein n=1 Tax=Streptomyces scopuliridis TaxID=452529 RepID=UPI0036C9ECA9
MSPVPRGTGDRAAGDRAVARGEIPAGTEATEVLRAVSAPLYYCFAISREPLTTADAQRSVAAALAGARAGAFRAPGSPRG